MTKIVKPASELEEKVNLAWTGGWDSTFRLLMLTFRQKKIVQPYYVLNTTRNSAIYEIMAMDRIKQAIAEKNPEAAKLIRPTIKVSFRDIAKDSDITDRVLRLQKMGHLGGQYDWLARLAKQLGIQDLEVCLHLEDYEHTFIESLVELEGGDKWTGGWRISRSKVNDIGIVFSNCVFPVSALTKKEMLNAATEFGFDDIMMLTWFCHNPKGGKPCGVCPPCRTTIEQGLGQRLPMSAIVRNKLLEKVVEKNRFLYTVVEEVYKRVRF